MPDLRQGVLLSPFSSTMAMAEYVTRLPVGFLVWHRFDNVARLKEIEAKGCGRVIILHGTSDEAIPVEMSRELAKDAPGTVHLVEIPGGRHNSFQEESIEEIRKAMDAVR